MKFIYIDDYIIIINIITMDKVSAQLYEFEMITDMVHDDRTTLLEIFIPEYNICFNTMNDTLNVFKSTQARNKISQIKHVWTDSAIKEAETNPGLAKFIQDTTKNEIPEQSTPITKIQLDLKFVEKLLEIVKMNEYIANTKIYANQYLVKPTQ